MVAPVLPPKPDALKGLFPRPKPIIGVIHLDALPGAPRYRGAPMREICANAVGDARTLAAGGVDGQHCGERRRHAVRPP